MRMIIKQIMLYFILSFLVFSCSQDTEWNQYKGIYFTINAPKDWEQSKSENVLVFKTKRESSSATFQDNFNVIVQDLGAEKMSLDDYSELTYNQVKQAVGEKFILNFKDATLSGIKAKDMSYIIPKDSTRKRYLDLEVHQKWIVKGNKAYVLTYTSQKENYEKYKVIVEKMFSSFKLK